MSSSSDLLDALASAGHGDDPGFEVVLAFEYFDGLDRGLGVSASGAAARILNIGDSRSGMFRAYELAFLDGDDWLQLVRRLPDVGEAGLSRLWGPPRDSEALHELERRASAAHPTRRYVGIGKSNLKWLFVCGVSEQQLLDLKTDGRNAYKAVHRLLKTRRRQ